MSRGEVIPPAPSGAASGFFGKLPARGDFVRAGLPGVFVTAWDGWAASALAGSREVMGEEWVPAWLEAPVWRFALSGGLCGPETAVGLLMASVDRAGRYFPLCFARLAPGLAPAAAAAAAEAWLAAAEAAGLAALAEDLSPEAVAARLQCPLPSGRVPLPPLLLLAAEGEGLWWTAGAPRVPAGGFALGGLPDPRRFAGMLDARFEAAGGGGG